MLAAVSLIGLVAANVEVPTEMLAWQGSGVGCDHPDWDCISQKTLSVPTPSAGEALIQVRGSSVNPINVDLVIPSCKYLPPPLGCSAGTLGNDGAGVVVSTGSSCGLKVGDEVYGGLQGAYAQYSLVNCAGVALKPKNINFVDAGALPVVAGTSVQCLNALGFPSKKANLTVVIASGQGGTGAAGIQLAKAMGATTVITAATGAGIEYVKKLGADVVVDYHQEDLWDFLGDDTVDAVYDNFGVPGTADKAMHAIRSGGSFLVLMGGNGGEISENPKEGVNQVSFGFASFGSKELSQIAAYYEAGKMIPITAAAYGFNDVKQAWTDKESGHFYGKLAIVPVNSTTFLV